MGLKVSEIGFQIEEGFIVRVAQNEWKLIGRKATGLLNPEPCSFTLVMPPNLHDNAVVGGPMKFISDTKEIHDDIGPIGALGNKSLTSMIVELEQRVQALEHGHAPTVEFTLPATVKGAIWELAAADAGLFDGAEHIIKVTGGVTQQALTDVISVVVKGADTAHTGPIRFLDERFVTSAMVDNWVTYGSLVTVKWDATAVSFRFVSALQVAGTP